jgi:hypothetical protein
MFLMMIGKRMPEKRHQFWKQIIINKEKFPSFSLALRLVALIQVSSCDVERVFSQLKNVVESTGTNMYEDMLEVRMFARCNGDMGKGTLTLYYYYYYCYYHYYFIIIAFTSF